MGVRLDPETKRRLKALSKKRDRSAHYLALTAIKRYLDEEEEYDRQRQADMEEWENYLQTGDAIPGEKVEMWLREMKAQRKYVEWRD
jgi:predicted transcriptional regulator